MHTPSQHKTYYYYYFYMQAKKEGEMGPSEPAHAVKMVESAIVGHPTQPQTSQWNEIGEPLLSQTIFKK